jgi:hypothetical protein
MGTRREAGDIRDVVRIDEEWRPDGPAKNSIVEVRQGDGARVARYLSWIGYGDLDDAEADEPRVWELVEPAEPYDARADWRPFN